MNKKLTILAPVILMFVILTSCQPSGGPKSLFNGKDLSGWDVYIAPPADSVPPLGLNQDPAHVFSVTTVDNAPAIRVSGESYGGLSTKEEYKNYHLTVQFKWGVAKIPSFANRKRDSGVLYHATGPHGVDARAWMRSQEFQVQEGDCGDYWGVAGATFDIPAEQYEIGQFVYDEEGTVFTFQDNSVVGRRCIKKVDAEKPYGEWNTVDIYCSGDSSVHVMNGTVVMRLYNSRQKSNNGLIPLTQGKIQLQSEGCEIYFRNIAIENITYLPKTLNP